MRLSEAEHQIAQLQAAAGEAARSAEAALAAERSRVAQLEAARREAEAASTASEGSGGASARPTAAAPIAAGAGAMVPIPQTVPAIAVGHEALYQWLLGGRLEYRPDPKSDAGLVTLSIGDLLRPLAGTANPLSATFDLSRCGDAWKYISINIGYKKALIPANANKTEVWLCPKFLAERELSTTAASLAPIMDRWEAPVGYFWTWGGEADASAYSYLLEGIVMDNDKTLYEKWSSSQHTRSAQRIRSRPTIDRGKIFL